MRVAHIVPQFDPADGGEAWNVRQLVRAQRLFGLSAEVVTLDRLDGPGARRLPPFDSIGGIPVRRARHTGWGPLGYPAGLLSYLEPFDLVHVHGSGPLARYLALTQILHRKPLVLSLGTREAALGKARQLLERLTMLPFKRIFVQPAEGEPRPVPNVPARKIWTIAEPQEPGTEAAWPDTARDTVRAYESLIGWRERSILGVTIRPMGQRQSVAHIDQALSAGERLNVCFANAHFLNIASENEAFRGALRNFLVLNDGIGTDIASRIKFGRPFQANLNGTDFVPHLLSRTRHALSIYLIGTSDEAVAKAARTLKARYPRHTIAGWRNGFFNSAEEIEETCRAVREARADCVLVGMGNPLQELWIDAHGGKTGAKLLIGVGALFDFEAGAVRRAPAWVRRAHCEWLYRLAQEPRRLFRRYVIGNVVFLGRAVADARS